MAFPNHWLRKVWDSLTPKFTYCYSPFQFLTLGLQVKSATGKTILGKVCCRSCIRRSYCLDRFSQLQSIALLGVIYYHAILFWSVWSGEGLLKECGVARRIPLHMSYLWPRGKAKMLASLEIASGLTTAIGHKESSCMQAMILHEEWGGGRVARMLCRGLRAQAILIN